MQRRSKVTTLGLYAVGIIYGLAILVPLLWILLLALKNALDAFAYPPLFIFEPTFEHFSAIFQDPEFRLAFANSVIIATGSVALAMVFAIPATFAITIMRGRARPEFAIDHPPHPHGAWDDLFAALLRILFSDRPA